FKPQSPSLKSSIRAAKTESSKCRGIQCCRPLHPSTATLQANSMGSPPESLRNFAMNTTQMLIISLPALQKILLSNSKKPQTLDLCSSKSNNKKAETITMARMILSSLLFAENRTRPQSPPTRSSAMAGSDPFNPFPYSTKA
ncbi:hypothetical protein F2P56_019804, partial [Juglans regia]